MAQINVRKTGNLADITLANGQSLPVSIRQVLEAALTYQYRRRVFGPARRYAGAAMEIEQRPLYRTDGLGRLVCGVGCVPRVQQLLEADGHQVTVTHEYPVHLDPRRFELDWDNLMRHYYDKFRPKQADCIAAIASNHCGIIKAPPGFGKGVVLDMAALLLSRAKIDIVIPGKDLVQKTVDRLTAHVPDVGQVGAGKKQFGRVTVYSADSLHLSDGKADVLLADEVHRLAAPTYAAPLAQYRHSRNYGLSASPTGRFDGADMVLESLFGPVIFEMSYQDAVAQGLVIPMRVEWVPVQMGVNPCSGKKDTAKERWGIWRNDTRNRAMAEKAMSYDANTQVLVMVKTLEHALFLREHLPGWSLCHSEAALSPTDIRFYRNNGLLGANESTITAKEREKMRKAFETGELKKVICTGVWSTGVDFVNLQVLIRGDAMMSEIADTQIPGRVSRTNDNKEIGVLVDFMDQFDESFRRKALARKKHYEANGWDQMICKSGV